MKIENLSLKASVSCKRVSGHPPACYFGGRLFWPLLSLFGTAHAQFNYQNNVTILSVVCQGNVQIVQDIYAEVK